MEPLMFVPACTAVSGLLLATRGVEGGRRLVSLFLALALGLSLTIGGGELLLPSVGAFFIAHALGSDVRERTVDVRLLLIGLGALLAVAAVLDGLNDGPTLRGVIGGGLVAAALATLLWSTGLLYARLRGIGIDPLTGTRAEAFGSGDIPSWALVGATLASPALALTAFLSATFIAALMSIVVLARRGDLPASDADGLAPDAAFIPLLPAIVLGAIVAPLVHR